MNANDVKMKSVSMQIVRIAVRKWTEGTCRNCRQVAKGETKDEKD